MQNQVAPGWYTAAGDPPGTQRYWDGIQWLGEPVLIAPVVATVAANGDVIPENLADYGKRTIGFLVDIAFWIPAFLFVGISDDGSEITTTTMEGLAMGLLGLTFVLQIGNLWLLQGITGQSIGKKVAKTRIVGIHTGQVHGVGRQLARLMLRALFGLLSCNIYTILDWLWPAWDPKRQRLTDKMLDLIVVNA